MTEITWDAHKLASKKRSILFLEYATTVSIILVIFAGQLVIGGGNNLAALSISASYGLCLFLLLTTYWGRSAFHTVKPLAVPFALFCSLIVYLVISISSIKFDHPHPIWGEIGESSKASIDISLSVLEIIKLLGLASIFLAGYALAMSRTRTNFAFKAILLMGTVYGAWSIVTFTLMPSTVMGFGYKQLFLDRLSGSYLSPNTAGTFFGTLVLLSISQAFALAPPMRINRYKSIERSVLILALPFVAFITALFSLLLTASRTAILATAACAATLTIAKGLLSRWHPVIMVAILIAVGLIATVAAGYAGDGAFVRRLSFLRDDTSVRAQIYSTHSVAIKNYPIMGFGIGSFDRVNKSLLTSNISEFTNLSFVRSMHNVIFQWLEGSGIIGLCLISVSIAWVIFAIGFGAKRTSTPVADLLGILAISFLIILHGLTDFALENFSFSGWWSILLGIGLGISSRRPYKLSSSPAASHAL